MPLSSKQHANTGNITLCPSSVHITYHFLHIHIISNLILRKGVLLVVLLWHQSVEITKYLFV